VPIGEVRAALRRFRIKRPPEHPELTAAALRRAIRRGGTVSSIARAAGVQRETVRTAMRRHGVVNPGANRGRRPVELDDAEWLRARHVDRAMTAPAIADELGVAALTVRRALQRHGVPLRPYVPPRADIDPAWLRQRFEVDLAPIAVIAAEAGVSPTTIRSESPAPRAHPVAASAFVRFHCCNTYGRGLSRSVRGIRPDGWRRVALSMSASRRSAITTSRRSRSPRAPDIATDRASCSSSSGVGSSVTSSMMTRGCHGL
jgi:transposase-like protein